MSFLTTSSCIILTTLLLLYQVQYIILSWVSNLVMKIIIQDFPDDKPIKIFHIYLTCVTSLQYFLHSPSIPINNDWISEFICNETNERFFPSKYMLISLEINYISVLPK